MTAETPSMAPKPFVFVLMPFDTQFSDIYKFGIKGAAEDVGAYAERLDEQLFSEGMLDRIFNQISKADVIVADMSERNPNVFYEVGYAHALGKVVILLTQKADDIPFDLKHWQHTVYGGNIEKLRSELAERLRWGIAESRRQSRGALAERLSIRLMGTDIPRSLSGAVLPVIGLVIREESSGRPFELPLQVRNDSYEPISGITHVYLFSERNTKVSPCRHETETWTSQPFFATMGASQSRTREVAVPLVGFIPSPVDVPDGLETQFRLPISVANLPPGAVESTAIIMMLVCNHKKIDTKFRLRLHTASQTHDFTFRLTLEYKEETARSRKGKEEAFQKGGDESAAAERT